MRDGIGSPIAEAAKVLPPTGVKEILVQAAHTYPLLSLFLVLAFMLGMAGIVAWTIRCSLRYRAMKNPDVARIIVKAEKDARLMRQDISESRSGRRKRLPVQRAKEQRG